MNRVVQIDTEFGLEHLIVTERPLPQTPGPGQVLIRMHAASLNARDLLTVKGLYNPRQTLPLIPCSDGAGEVVAAGEQVERVAPGDRVITCFAQGWVTGPLPTDFRSITLGGPLDGTLAEYMIVHESGLVQAPGDLKDEEVATLPCAGLTAWNALKEEGNISKDDVVVVQGTGGVALFALQFAVALGARVILISKSDEKLERAKRLGASHLINYREHPEWSRSVKELTDGRGADHVIELGGSATLRNSIRAVRSGGVISMIGVLTGSVAEIDLPLVVMRNVRLQGVTVGSRDSLERMLSFVWSRGIHPVVDKVYPLAETIDAFKYLESAAHFGKICVTPT
jgi:NADPH:quinone reductase-like Zn-dependent oxidoreductase